MASITILLLTTFCCLIALSFVIPPIWTASELKKISVCYRYGVSLGLALSLPLAAYIIYYNSGAHKQLSVYYSPAQHAQRVNNRQVRPLYARLQRELIKNKLNMNIDLANLDLILYVANLDSKLSNGALEPDTKKLLERVLLVVPQQITALNLLAVHSFKSGAYKQAVDYWEKILQQFTSDMHNSSAEKALTAKIAEARLFESKLTN